MDFDEALRAHVAWKSKLSAYVPRPDHSIDPSHLCLDNACMLGKWIHGEARKYASLPEYQKLLTRHAAFHRAAADVVRRADSGENVSEEISLGKSSAFSTASSDVVGAINEMKRKA